jgi:hypothetical protein
LTWSEKLSTVIPVASSESPFMSKRFLSLIAIASIASVLFTAVAHACSDLTAMQAILKAPCDHNSSQDEPGNKAGKDNCDLVRYGMLSTKASSSHPELVKLYSIPFDDAFLVNVSLPDILSLLWRSQGPPLVRLGVSPRLSHVVLRI